MNTESLRVNKRSWEEAAERFYGRNPLPEYGPLAPTENELKLFGDVRQLKMLEIGCGSGHSLKYLDQRGAGELWGLDLSTTQISAAKALLENTASPVKLFESPMEKNPGIPADYFDIIFSIYAIGWTTDLDKTIKNIHQYLKKGGVFIFSWEHPMYNRVNAKDGVLLMDKSYHDEGSYLHEAWSQPAIMQQYKLSTYINLLIENGFKIEKVVEDIRLSEKDLRMHENRWYSYEKAKALPAAFIIKSRRS
ncbi:class I SAM-dependent methyltransferase [Bacillus sp. ISL-47]|uniref:class I SAM-dependent methyltransferase n=1 Tax=Bacillus sp. ISL-47 TaxID=2819130 RepID=UPI001BE6EC6B|nr:class I SAM-dependent methyltransferase [Bacillus sp. ISL-47]MBT2691271.1 class I SAM-dependent methyltransferase [Bacillus sp. ISL-47]MBT2710965.1 class I SAM-dependent methyltransferase [Pseudomonas sp. ISL-84]